ncbi:MAG TPA: response regulator transcription factor [Gemmatimonadaceae bacterium]|jgi:DNA-binding NarL/FixJ family response regulator|nr:response regulator transcription factor [Gemmatimonadaceae bacterium]
MGNSAHITILSADDHPLIRSGLQAVISLESDMRMIAEAANGEEAIEMYREHRPDVVLMDLRMPVMDGLTAMTAILKEFPEARIVALTTYEGDDDIHRALSVGARGYLLKDMMRSELLRVIRTVHAGERAIPPAVAARLAEFTPRVELTPREREVLHLMAKGFGNREIARLLGRTESTMKVHVSNILEKLGATDRTEAVTLAMQRGILHLE